VHEATTTTYSFTSSTLQSSNSLTIKQKQKLNVVTCSPKHPKFKENLRKPATKHPVQHLVINEIVGKLPVTAGSQQEEEYQKPKIIHKLTRKVL
jgi:hypothetical protein